MRLLQTSISRLLCEHVMSSFLWADTSGWGSGRWHSRLLTSHHCHLVSSCSVYFGHFSKCTVLCNCAFQMHFPVTNSAERFFSCDVFCQTCIILRCCRSVTVTSTSLRPRGRQHARLPCITLHHSVFLCIPQSLLTLMSVESVMSPNLLILCLPLLLLPSVFPSTRVFSSELALHIRWPEY